MKRRHFLKISAAASAGAMVRNRMMFGAVAAPGLSDPTLQPKFVNLAPNALAPGFIYQPGPDGKYRVAIKERKQWTGLVNSKNGRPLYTKVWGYGYDDEKGVSWPGRTFQVDSGPSETTIRWDNMLQGKKHLLPVDTNLHWCYSLHGTSSANGMDYTQYSIRKNGVPIITHLHG